MRQMLLRLSFIGVLGLVGHLVCAEGTKSAAERVAARPFPSVFQAWSGADNLPDEDRMATLARHDLVFSAPSFFRLKWAGEFEGMATAFTDSSRLAGQAMRVDLLKRNQHMVLLAELRYRDARASYLPPDHEWWKRKNGQIVPGWTEGSYLLLDFSNPAYRAQVAQQAKAIMASGVFDGIMLDWWQDDEDRLALIKEIRAQVGEDALILGNANDRATPLTAPYLNGYFMECYKSKNPRDWRQIADTLQWAETHLREPRINCLETWYHNSRQDLSLMRATTTLALTLSDGYCLFSDPNPLPTPDHLHDWYPFWQKTLGAPTAAGIWCPDGSAQRQFQNGLAVYNPLGNAAVTVTFTSPRLSASTQNMAKTFRIEPGDGDLLLLPKER
jgi:hypothetical protein